MAITTKYNPRDTLKHVDSLINKQDYKEREKEYGYDKPENAMPFSRELGNSIADLMLQIQKDYYKFVSSSEKSVGSFISELTLTTSKLNRELLNTQDYKKYQPLILKVQSVSAEVTTLLNNALNKVNNIRDKALLKMYDNLGDVKKLLSKNDGGEVELKKIKKHHDSSLKIADVTLEEIKKILEKAYDEAINKVMSVAQEFDTTKINELKNLLVKNRKALNEVNQKGKDIQDALKYIPEVPDLSQVKVPVLFPDKDNKAIGIEGYSTPFLMMPDQKPKDFASLLTNAMEDVLDVCDIVETSTKQAKMVKEKSFNPYIADLENKIKDLADNVLNFFDKSVKQIIPEEIFELTREAKEFLKEQKDLLKDYDETVQGYGNLKNIIINDTGILGTEKLANQINSSMNKIGGEVQGVVGEMLKQATQKTMQEFNNIMGPIPFLKDIFSQHMSGSQNELSKMDPIHKHGPKGGIDLAFQPNKFDSQNNTIKKAEAERMRAKKGVEVAEARRADDAKKILKKLRKDIAEQKTSKISQIGIEKGEGKTIGGLCGDEMGTRIEKSFQSLVNGASYSLAYSQQTNEVTLREQELDANKNMDNKITLTNKSKDAVSSVVGSCDRGSNWAINAYTRKFVNNYHIDSIRKENVDLHSQSEQGLLQTQLPKEEIVAVFVDMAQNNYDAAVDILEHLDNVKGRIDEWHNTSKWMDDFNKKIIKLKKTFNKMKKNKNTIKKVAQSKLLDIIKDFISKFLANFKKLFSNAFGGSDNSNSNSNSYEGVINIGTGQLLGNNETTIVKENEENKNIIGGYGPNGEFLSSQDELYNAWRLHLGDKLSHFDDKNKDGIITEDEVIKKRGYN